jgi:hypothetical protein
VEVDLREFGEMVAAMPLFARDDRAALPPLRNKPSIDDVLTTPVHAGGEDAWTRFDGASAAIGHFIRLVHDGRVSPNEGWEAICQYNAAMLRPAWPIERLKQEADRLWARHVAQNGPPLLRLEPDMAAPATIPVFSLRQLLDDTSPMPEDIIAPRLLTPGGLLVLGGAPKVGKSDFLISLLVHMAAGVPFLGFAPPHPLRVFYLQAEIQYHYLRERMQGIRLDASVIAAARENLFATPKLKLILDDKGLALVAAAIRDRLSHRSRSNVSHCISSQWGQGRNNRRRSDASYSCSIRDTPWMVGVEARKALLRQEKVRVRASASATGSPSSSAEGG